MGHAKPDSLSFITRQEFLRRMGAVGLAAVATGVVDSCDAPIASAGKPTPQPTFTETLGAPGAPSKIPRSVAVAQDDSRI